MPSHPDNPVLPSPGGERATPPPTPLAPPLTRAQREAMEANMRRLRELRERERRP